MPNRPPTAGLGVTLALCVIIGPGCSDSPSGPSASNPALTETTTSVHYTIHSAPGDTVDTARQDAYYEWFQTALQLQPSPRLDYYSADRGHLKALTGRDTNGFADAGTTRFHTIWPTDNHEGVHTVVILQIGHPPPLFTEGIAVAHQTNPPQGILRPRWNGIDLHERARRYDAAGRLPRCGRSTREAGTSSIFDVNVTYPCAGSFVLYLIDSQGLAPLKRYSASATSDDAASTTESRFLAAYGRPLTAV